MDGDPPVVEGHQGDERTIRIELEPLGPGLAPPGGVEVVDILRGGVRPLPRSPDDDHEVGLGRQPLQLLDGRVHRLVGAGHVPGTGRPGRRCIRGSGTFPGRVIALAQRRRVPVPRAGSGPSGGPAGRRSSFALPSSRGRLPEAGLESMNLARPLTYLNALSRSNDDSGASIDRTLCHDQIRRPGSAWREHFTSSPAEFAPTRARSADPSERALGWIQTTVSRRGPCRFGVSSSPSC